MSLVPLCITIINVHDPDLILLVYMLPVPGRLATLKLEFQLIADDDNLLDLDISRIIDN